MPGPCCDIALNVNKTDGTCLSPLASATAIATSSYLPITYVWSNGDITQDIDSVPAGTYTVTVTDDNSCVNIVSVTVSEPTALALNSQVTHVQCFAGNNGAIDLTVSGGTASYTYVWSTTPARTTATITGLRVGTFTVTITDSKACNIVRTVNVTGVPPLTVGSVPSPVLCNGGNNGSINLTVNGGTPGYTFQWSNGATTEDISGLTAGTYNVTVTDANNCTRAATIRLTDAPAMAGPGDACTPCRGRWRHRARPAVQWQDQCRARHP